MPTGYTSNLYEGKEQTFEEFVMCCVRAMGVCVEMRDDSWDAPIPEKFEPSDYHSKELQKAKEKLFELNSLSPEQAEKRAQDEYEEEVNNYNDSLIKKHELEKRYNDMLNKVNRWNPPTPEHNGFKKFMVEQLTSSIDFDCKFCLDFPKLLTGQKWLAEQIKGAKRSIKLYDELNAKEIQRANERTKWMTELRRSLKEQL